MYRNVYFRGALLLSIWLLPGLLTGRRYSAGTHRSTDARSAGQAVAGSIGPAAAVHGSHCLQPCSGWLAVHGCWLAAACNSAKLRSEFSDRS
eukprot:COSAG01_NODE_14739_length_1416_cov_2.679575_1_plen_91_part_10